MAMAFDTLGYARRLQEQGISREEAEAHANALGETVLADLVTRADLKAELGLLELRMTRQLYAVAVGIVAVTVGAIGLIVALV